MEEEEVEEGGGDEGDPLLDNDKTVVKDEKKTDDKKAVQAEAEEVATLVLDHIYYPIYITPPSNITPPCFPLFIIVHYCLSP